MGTEDLLTPAECARELRLAEKTLRNLRSNGGGPAFLRVGRLIRYRRADVASYLASRAWWTTDERRRAK